MKKAIKDTCLGSENHTELRSWDSFLFFADKFMGKSVRDYAFAAAPDYIKSHDSQTLISTKKKCMKHQIQKIKTHPL